MSLKKLTFILALLCFMVLSSSAFAEQWGDFTYTVSGSDNITITGYTGAGGAVEILDNITGMPVVSIGEWAFGGRTGLTSVTIPGSVTSIGDWAFNRCTGLTSVTIQNGVTSIGWFAFNECYSLSSVTIPASVTSIVWNPFSICPSLTSIIVDTGNTAYISNNGVVYSKDGTILIACPGGKTGALAIPDGVTSIGAEAFAGCAGLTSVTIPGSVTSIGYAAFLFCFSLTSVTIPGSVTSIDSRAFIYCTGLTSAYFCGNAPTTMSTDVFDNCASGFTVYYLAGATGFTNPWYGCPTEVFTPITTTTTTVCPAPDLNAPDGADTIPLPTFSWQNAGGVGWYNLAVYSTAGSGGYVATQWFEAASICSGGTCSTQLSNALPSGTFYWWVNTWGANSCGLQVQPGGKYKQFTVTGCAGPALTAPTGTVPYGTRPAHTFTSNAEWVDLQIYSSTIGAVSSQWVDAASACTMSSCSVTPVRWIMALGQNWWWVNTWSTACGYQFQPGGNLGSYTIVP